MNTPLDMSEAALRARLIRNFNDTPPGGFDSFERAPLYASQGKQLSAGTAAKKLGLTMDIVPPGKQSCPYHLHHVHEEMFIVLEGSGTLRVAGQRLAIKAGDVIFIPPGPEYPHHIVNTSDAPLKYLSLSTKEYPEVCEYPDSGKFMAWAWKDGTETLAELHKSGSTQDYWDGEP